MTPALTLTATDTEIDRAILAALAARGRDDLHRWSVIRHRLAPIDADRLGERLTALLLAGRAYVITVGGRVLVGLGDADDLHLAERRRAEGRVVGPRTI